MSIQLDLGKETPIVQSKTDLEIEKDSAISWAGKSASCFEIAAKATDSKKKLAWLKQAEDYRHEALEHAALSSDKGILVGQIETLLDQYRNKVEKNQPTSSEVHVNKPLGEEVRKKQVPEGNAGKAMAADLITFPDDIDGTKCANCKFVDLAESFCDHPNVYQKLQDGPMRMCCDYWDHKGVVRASGEVTKGMGIGATMSPEKINSVRYFKADDINPPKINSGMGAEIEKEDELPDAPYRMTEGLADNSMAGLYDMQQIVNGIDWEMEYSTSDEDMAKEMAIDNLSNDPDYYRKKRIMSDATDDQLQKGLKLDLGSGLDRKKGHLGLDLYKHDHGTIVHDLNLGIPVPDKSADRVQLCNALEYMDDMDPKALLSEIQRVLMPTGEFVYEGPNELYNYPSYLVMTGYEEPDSVHKVEGQPWVKQTFTRIAMPDAATANDAEPRIGIAQYDNLPADALLAMDALGYYWSDATSSGRGNRIHGYPSQGALVNTPLQKGVLDTHAREHIKPHNFAIPVERKYPIEDISHARNALARVGANGTPEEKKKVQAAVYRKYPSLKPTEKSAVKKIIRQEKGKWKLFSHEGKNLGEFNTKEEAERHEKQVNYFKYKDKTEKGGPGSGPHPGSGSKKDNQWNESKYISKPNPYGPKGEYIEHEIRVGNKGAKVVQNPDKTFSVHSVTHYSSSNPPKDHPFEEFKGGYSSQFLAGGTRDMINGGHKEGFKTLGEAKEHAERHLGLKKSVEKIQKKVPIFKVDKHKQIVYGIVLEPNEVDSQDDYMEPEDIEKAAHAYLEKSRVIGSDHTRKIGALPVESYISPVDFKTGGQYGDQDVKKGSWIVGVKVQDPQEWQKVLDGDYQGFSIGGFGLRSKT